MLIYQAKALYQTAAAVEEIIERGEIAVIEKAKSKYLAIPKKLNESLLKEKVEGENGEVIEPVIEYEFTLLDNSNVNYKSKDVSKYVIFKLNREGLAILTGLNF